MISTLEREGKVIAHLSSSTLPLGFTLRHCLRGRGGRIHHMAWAPDGQRLAAVGMDPTICLWDVETTMLRPEVMSHEGPVMHVAWSPDGQTLATGSTDQPISLWEVSTGQQLRQIETHTQNPLLVAWSPDGQLINAALLTGAYPQAQLRLYSWVAETGLALPPHHDARWELAYPGVSADRRLLALALTDGSIQVWDVATLRLIATLKGRHCRIYGIARSPDEQVLALSLDDGVIQVWNLLNPHSPYRLLSEHDKPVYSVVFSADGHLFAAKSMDGTVRLWRCDTWAGIAKLDEPSVGSVEVEIAFHPTLPRLATFAAKNTVIRIWDLDLHTLCLWGVDTVIPILFLSANPRKTPPLRLDEELREIREKLQLATLRARFDFQPRTAVRPEDLSQGLLAVRPRIVHFSGHGTPEGAICLEDKLGTSHPVPPNALAALFELVADHVECVVLNACYSEQQAKAIAKFIHYVIGMSHAISDKAAIAFTIGFYQALGEGKSVEEAYRFGCVHIRLHNIPEPLTPVLIKKA